MSRHRVGASDCNLIAMNQKRCDSAMPKSRRHDTIARTSLKSGRSANSRKTDKDVSDNLHIILPHTNFYVCVLIVAKLRHAYAFFLYFQILSIHVVITPLVRIECSGCV